MRKLILILLMLVMGKAFGQVYQLMPQYGYDAKRMKFDSTLQIPTVCGVPTLKSNVLKYAAIAYDSCNKRLYYYDPKLLAWDTIKGGGAALDTTSLSNRINNKVDSVKRIGDSVKYYKNGIAYFGYKDSIGGGGQNGRWGNDTATIVLAKVHNATGTQLTRGTVVMLKGSNGDVASVIRANNKADSTSARTIGLVKDNIASGDTGWVVTQGQASKLNLGSYAEGDVLYLDSIDGGLTKVKPQAPYHQVFIGIVERANNGNGLMYVKPANGFEINELHDVAINNPINNQVLVYSDTQKLWKNRNVYSVVDTTSLSNRINSIDLQSVTDNGDTTTNDIYLPSFYIFDGPGEKYYNFRVADSYFEIRDDAPNDVFSVSADNSFVKFGGTNHATIEYTTLTNDRNYYLPDNTGTFMLTGDSTLYQSKFSTDTMRANVYDKINIKLNKSDTASLSNRINTKLNMSDSTIYQTKFSSDTARTNTYTAIANREAPLTFSTGLTRATNTITSNLSTGVSGGQSVVGGTASGNNLTLSSTSNATKGKILFGTSTYDEANNRLGIGTQSPVNPFDVIRGTAGAMERNSFESGSFSFNGDMKVGVYTSSSTATDGAALSFAQTNLQANSRYPGFDMQYVYSSTVANNAWRLNYTERSSAGAVQNYAANLFAVYADGRAVLNPAVLNVTSSAKLFVGHNTDAGFMVDVNGTGRFSQQLTTNGSRIRINAKTGAYTATSTDDMIPCDATSAGFTITLPTASGRTGQQYTIKKTDNSANAVTVGTTSSQTIDGSATYSLATQWKYVTVVSNGSNWLIISNN